MAVYYAEIEYTVSQMIRLELADDEEPTDEAVFEAAAYVDNHLDNWISEGIVIAIEKDES